MSLPNSELYQAEFPASFSGLAFVNITASQALQVPKRQKYFQLIFCVSFCFLNKGLKSTYLTIKM